jgi:anion-transporting  ArsA/GET3 family ATPase
MPAAVPAKLVVVMGKGGVGKTTLSAALALAHAAQGRKVALVSLGAQGELQRTVRAGWGEPPPELAMLELEPRAVVDQVVAQLLPIPGLATLVTNHPAYDAVYRIAPGVKELGVLHRLLSLGDRGYERIVVDGLATGHGTHFLEVPRKSAHLLVGQLAERARAIDAALRDPARTSVLVATTLEEMPMRETVQLAANLQAGGFPLDGILANRVLERLFPSAGALEALDELGKRGQAAQVGSEVGASWGAVQRMVHAARYLEGHARDMAQHLASLELLGPKVLRLPLLPRDAGRLRALAPRLTEVAA